MFSPPLFATTFTPSTSTRLQHWSHFLHPGVCSVRQCHVAARALQIYRARAPSLLRCTPPTTCPPRRLRHHVQHTFGTSPPRTHGVAAGDPGDPRSPPKRPTFQGIGSPGERDLADCQPASGLHQVCFILCSAFVKRVLTCLRPHRLCWTFVLGVARLSPLASAHSSVCRRYSVYCWWGLNVSYLWSPVLGLSLLFSLLSSRLVLPRLLFYDPIHPMDL